MPDRDYTETSRELWAFFTDVIRRIVDLKSMSRRAIAKTLEVHPGTVARWYKGERGDKYNVPLNVTIDRLSRLGVGMDEILKHLAPEHGVFLLAFVQDYRDHTAKLAKIYRSGGQHLAHLLSTIDLIDKQINNKD